MRRADAACALALAGALVGHTVGAQEAQGAGKSSAQPLRLHRQALGTEGLADVGRTRMRNGDCAGALEAFDGAIRASTAPALHRDRGLCHERLGHAYPAIDDFRAYLTAAPDAPDAEGIRERLVKLEQETLGYSSASTDVPGEVEGGASASASADLRSAKVSAPGAAHAQMDYVEREDDPLLVPLRRGKGWSVAPWLSEHKWGASPASVALSPRPLSSGASFGDSGTWAECVGLEARYSIGPSGALVLEAGYEHFNSTVVDLAVVAGLTSQIGYEWRFPLDGEYQNQLILMAGLGYEHLVVRPNDAQAAGVSLGGFVPRVRFGWRHLLAPSAGVEASVDGGGVNFFAYDRFPFDSNNPTTFLVALNVALVWAL
jgi:tetratricopeptide repeat protein